MSIIENFNGSKVVDEKGHSLGAVTDVVYDGAGNSPTWLVVKPGLLRSEHYVPAKGAYRTEDGMVVLPYLEEQIKSAPKAKGDHVLGKEERALITQHYHLEI